MAKQPERRAAKRFKYEDSDLREGRVASGYTQGRRIIKKAEIYDISHIGVAFRVSGGFAPEIGELVAVEFKLPNLDTMAWYAQVIRVELDYVSIDPVNGNTPILKIGASFIESSAFQKRQLEKHIDHLLAKVQSDQPSRIRILTDSLTIRRSHEISVWQITRAMLIFAVSAALAFEFVSYMMKIGSPELRYKRPPIVTDLHKVLPDDFPEEPQGK